MSVLPACLYTETRLDLDPTQPDAVVDLLLPTSNTSAFASRASPKRRRVERTPTRDEALFTSRHLATYAGIHFRPTTKSQNYPRPRSVLWRILEDNSVLELQATDLYQERREIDAPILTLRFAFPSKIIPGGIAFAESQSDALSSPGFFVFAITNAGELYWLKLRKEAFIKHSFLEESASFDWCKSFAAPAFYSRRPYRMCANGESELWVSLHDGSLLRLRKQQNDTWSETYFNETSWSLSVRRLNLFHGQATAQYGDTDLDAKSAAAMALSPDAKYVWTVCLDHTLRAWNIADGKLAIGTDLAGDTTRDLKKPIDQLMDPGASCLLEILPSKSSDHYQIVVFSPIKQEFRFWNIRDPDSPADSIGEAYSDFAFVPPVEELINASAWTMERFCIRGPTPGDGKEWSLWILVRSGTKCHTFNIVFSPDAANKKLTRTWKTNWKECTRGASVEEMRTRLDCPIGYVTELDAEDITDRWTKFLFHPGRFSQATLETAAVVYSRSLGRSGPKGLGIRREPLIQHVCSTVGSAVALDTTQYEGASYAAYAKAVASQWEIFYGVVQDLQKQRERPLSLEFDHTKAVPWLVTTDQIAPIRECSEVEILWYNRSLYAEPQALHADSVLLHALPDSGRSEIGQFFEALSFFRSALAKPFVRSFNSVLQSELLAPSGAAASERMQALYDQSGFNGQVTDEDYNILTDLLEPFGGFSQLSNKFLSSVLAMLGEKQQGPLQEKEITPYGQRMLIRGAQETLQLSEDIAVDLLLLVIFMTCELDPGDLPDTFDGYELYGALLEKMKELSLLSWMASTIIEGRRPGLNTYSKTFDTKQSEPARTETYLEECCAVDWNDMGTPNQGEDVLITYWIRAWTFGPRATDLWDKITPKIMAMLLQTGDLKHAGDFLRFLSHLPWASYIKARFYLASGDYDEAASLFLLVADDLAFKFNVEANDTEGLVAVDERNNFNDGHTSFYQHVAALFEKAKAMSYVADFATLALEAFDEDSYDDQIREDLKSRLFAAYIQTSRLSDAFSTLTTQKVHALRHSGLQRLLSSALAHAQIDLLLSFEWPDDLAQEADAHLSSLCAPDASTSLLSATETPTAPHHILYAWRVARHDFRGAAACLYERLQILCADAARGLRGADKDDERAAAYLAVLNCLALVDDSMQWLLVQRPLAAPNDRRGRTLMLEDADASRAKRAVVTIDDVRREWQEELDRVADVKAGRVPFGFDGEMEDDTTDSMPGAFGTGAMEVDALAS